MACMTHRPHAAAPVDPAVDRAVAPVRRVLALAVAIPAIYFGIQVAATPFHPQYSFLTRDASTLGSSESTAPWIFNTGALVLAILKVALAGAFLAALPRAGIGRVLATLTALALASAGIASLNAFLHPLPDPRHTEGLLSLLGSGLALLPVLIALVLWRLGARRYAVVHTLLCLALIPLMTGLGQRICMWAGIDFSGYQFFLNNYHGLLQRLGAAIIYIPLAVAALLLRRAISPHPPVPRSSTHASEVSRHADRREDARTQPATARSDRLDSNPNAKELIRYPALDRALESSQPHEEPLVGLDVLHGANELLQRR
jgi:hypothetical protein